MRRAALALALLLAACSDGSNVLIHITLAANAQSFAAGPALLSLYTPSGRVVDAHTLDGKLPGDVLVLVPNDGDGPARALVRVTSPGSGAEGVGIAPFVPRGRTTIEVELSPGTLLDSDGDGVPNSIDDCPNLSDPLQNDPCAKDGGVGDDLGGTDGAVGPDMTMPPPPGCGDGIVQSGEACDDGSKNSNDPASLETCSTMCQKRAPCGSLTNGGTPASGASVDPTSGHCYVAWSTPQPWANAEYDCLTRGGHLAAVTTTGEETRVKQLANATASWLGATSFVGGTVTWSDGETSTFTDFSAGQPSGAATSCVVEQTGGAGWTDEVCGFPTEGELPPSTPQTNGYVCENSCGNGVVEPGEECDPPASGTCTSACRKLRACTEPGGIVSAATGFCYFATAATYDYADAHATACPAGTHLATPDGLMESAAVQKAISTDSWIAVMATVTIGDFVFDEPSPLLDLPRYHGFVAPDPDLDAVPACAAFTYMDARGDGWRDRDCTTLYPAVCERDQ